MTENKRKRNIAPVLNIDQEKMVTIGILIRIDDGVYVCIFTVYSKILKKHTHHSFVYDSYFSTKVKSACRGAIIDNRKYAPICVPEEKYRKSKETLNNKLRKLFEGTCTVKYALKVTSHESP